METKGGVTRSRDSKDFFEEKQLVTLRPNTRWRAIAEHANLLRLMPRTDVHWVSDIFIITLLLESRGLCCRVFWFEVAGFVVLAWRGQTKVDWRSELPGDPLWMGGPPGLGLWASGAEWAGLVDLGWF
ncbi:hypothetical protein NDU88_007341 [Pleurodeles waltl]|uniref:Uncharacterized protein n=1 Tax=Pleurodeles waltl TaxID=8319 RepID=A0AAV7LXE6_PLEWA|nr:hypothetical protein NDU88_007341 [Pleurodeles waltl]